MKKTVLAIGLAASLVAAPALAQTTTTTADPAMSSDAMMTQPVEDDNDFPWGLLGLLGLAGLLGRKRDTHVHTDTTRRNP